MRPPPPLADFRLLATAADELENHLPSLLYYIDRLGLADRVRPVFRVSQDDQEQLSSLIQTLWGAEAELDLVTDDASHLYRPSTATFDALFPRIKEGGFYAIEDWGWPHWPGFETPPASIERISAPVFEHGSGAGHGECYSPAAVTRLPPPGEWHSYAKVVRLRQSLPTSSTSMAIADGLAYSRWARSSAQWHPG